MRTAVGLALRGARALRLAARPGPSARVALRWPGLPVGRDPDGLTPWQAASSRRRLDALRPLDRRRVDDVLGGDEPGRRAAVRRALAAGAPASDVLGVAGQLAGRPAGWLAEHLELVDGLPGPQRRFGVPVDQVDGTTCGTTVLIVLASRADPRFALALTAEQGFGDRFDALQRTVHRQSNTFWPRAVGTSPWGMVAWLRRHAPGAGPYRVRLVDDESGPDVAAVAADVDAALDAAAPVPLLVGAFLPRHYVLALAPDDARWRVYEPTSGEVRLVDPAAIRQQRLAPALGFDRLHAVLLPHPPDP